MQQNFSLGILDQALGHLPLKMDTPKARFMLLAIGYQESKMKARFQVPRGIHPVGTKGPARGLWQFERGGGTHGVMRHEASRDFAKSVCDSRDVEWNATAIWERFEHDDVLACAFARLLLWTDPRPLPGRDEIAKGWECYYRNWRPGAPRLAEWSHAWRYATETLPT